MHNVYFDMEERERAVVESGAWAEEAQHTNDNEDEAVNHAAEEEDE